MSATEARKIASPMKKLYKTRFLVPESILEKLNKHRFKGESTMALVNRMLLRLSDAIASDSAPPTPRLFGGIGAEKQLDVNLKLREPDRVHKLLRMVNLDTQQDSFRLLLMWASRLPVISGVKDEEELFSLLLKQHGYGTHIFNQELLDIDLFSRPELRRWLHKLYSQGRVRYLVSSYGRPGQPMALRKSDHIVMVDAIELLPEIPQTISYTKARFYLHSRFQPDLKKRGPSPSKRSIESQIAFLKSLQSGQKMRLTRRNLTVGILVRLDEPTKLASVAIDCNEFEQVEFRQILLEQTRLLSERQLSVIELILRDPDKTRIEIVHPSIVNLFD